jgi:predicted RNase H-like HicB family nuclease
MKRTYLVVFAKCNGSNFSGHAPDVPGCVSTGDTLGEMTTQMREALEFHLEGMAEDGETAPEALTTKIEFQPTDFEDVEYFVVEKLDVTLPDQQQAAEPPAHQAA